MRYMLRITVGVALLVACLAGRTDAADGARAASSKAPANAPASSKSLAEKLVREALEAELAGDAAERARLLEAAMKEDPELTAARWQSGQMKVGKAWVTVDDVAQSNANNLRLAEYRRRRDGLVDTADSQRELARWCDKQQLKSEARVHWIKLLEYEPTDSEAIKALDLQQHQGRLITREQYHEERLALSRRNEAIRKWQPRIQRWRADLASKDSRRQDATIEEMASFDEPDVLPALETALGLNGDHAKAVTLNEALVRTLDRMPVQAATDILVRRAVLAGSELVRTAAARALSRRPPATWMIQMIAQLPPHEEVSTSHRFYWFRGTLWRFHEATIHNRDSGQVTSVLLTDLELPQAGSAPPVDRLATRGTRFLADSMKTDLQIAKTSEQQEMKRARVNMSLQIATGSEGVLPIDQWLKKAEELSETYSPAEFSNPIASRFIEVNQVRITPSCFPAGTPVLTNMGLVPVDKLKPGDQVVAQNVETGELAIQPIQQVTLRPAVPLVEIEAGGNTIRATRGHPFWVNGQGWLMAKHLQAGQYLHTPGGPLAIERIGEQPAQEAYNLVVSDFATYFVGPQKILVHDNQPLQGTGMLVPGLVARDVKP